MGKRLQYTVEEQTGANPNSAPENAEKGNPGQSEVAKDFTDAGLDRLDEKNIPTTTKELLAGTMLQEGFGVNFEKVAQQADEMTGTYVDAMLGHILDPETRKRFAAAINATIIGSFERILKNPNGTKTPETKSEDKTTFSRSGFIEKAAGAQSFQKYFDGLKTAFGPLLSIYGGYDLIKSTVKSFHNIAVTLQKAHADKLIDKNGIFQQGGVSISWANTSMRDPRQFAGFVLDNTAGKGLKLDGSLMDLNQTNPPSFLAAFLANTVSYDTQEGGNIIGDELKKMPEVFDGIANGINQVYVTTSAIKKDAESGKFARLKSVVEPFKDFVRQSPALNAVVSFLLGPGRGGDSVAENVVNYARDSPEYTNTETPATSANPATGSGIENVETAGAGVTTISGSVEQSLTGKKLFDLLPSEATGLLGSLIGNSPLLDFIATQGNLAANILAVSGPEKGFDFVSLGTNADGTQTASGPFQASAKGGSKGLEEHFTNNVQAGVQYLKSKGYNIDVSQLSGPAKNVLFFIGHTTTYVKSDKYTTGEYAHLAHIYNNVDERMERLKNHKLNESVDGPMLIAAFQRGVYDFNKILNLYNGANVDVIASVNKLNIKSNEISPAQTEEEFA